MVDTASWRNDNSTRTNAAAYAYEFVHSTHHHHISWGIQFKVQEEEKIYERQKWKKRQKDAKSYGRKRQASTVHSGGEKDQQKESKGKFILKFITPCNVVHAKEKKEKRLFFLPRLLCRSFLLNFSFLFQFHVFRIVLCHSLYLCTFVWTAQHVQSYLLWYTLQLADVSKF